MVLIFLIGCKTKHEEINTKNADTTLIESPILNDDTISIQEIENSWKVALEINEGYFESYTINYNNGKQLTVPVDNNIPLIGGVDHSSAHFINDTTYFVPHVAASKNGHFELYIFKNGSCRYQEVITRKQKKTIIDEVETVISQAQQTNQKQPEINNNYTQTATEIKFTRKIIDFGDSSIGCSNSQIEIVFSIPTSATDTFYMANNDLKTIDFSYHYSGGLYEETSQELLKGYIKGTKQIDNSWLIETDFWFKATSFPQGKEVEKKLKLNEVYQ
ncbi:MAG: hypothetical protein H6588_03385 [Flavobacteriales bacterium]|nr:hypothetical protein [Flavobacteriales bacterium]